MISALCLCGFTELADETFSDHLQRVFEPDDHIGKDGLVHVETERLRCRCGLAAVTAEKLDAHFLAAFTPEDAIGRDGARHEPVQARDEP